MPLTNDDRAALATELCGLELCYTFNDGTGSQWWTLPCGELIPKDDFDPVNNWNHMRLVLEGLVKKGYRYKIYSPGAYTDEGLGPVGTFECWIYKTDNGIRIACCGCSVDSLGSAVCKAGLEVIGRDGG